MLETYVIHFKEQGNIKFAFRRFEIDRGRIIVYDSNNDPAVHQAFLSLEQVAALFPEKRDEDPVGFTVRLINGDSFLICADSFMIEESNLTFYRYQNYRNQPLKNIHVALDAVAAITPQAGLERA